MLCYPYIKYFVNILEVVEHWRTRAHEMFVTIHVINTSHCWPNLRLSFHERLEQYVTREFVDGVISVYKTSGYKLNRWLNLINPKSS